MRSILILLSSLICFTLSTVQAEIKLGLNWKAEPQFGGFYAAEVEGIFKKAGLEVKIKEGGSGTPTIQMLATEQLDYAIVSADEIVLAHDRGSKDIVAIYASFQINPQCLLVQEQSAIASLPDLFKNSEMTLLWQEGLPYAMFLKNKYGPISVKTAPYFGGIGSMQKDPKVAQQGFATSEPLIARKAGLKVRTFLVAESGYNPYTTVLAVHRKRIKSQPAEVKKMIEAVREGWAAYIKDPTKTNKMMSGVNKAMDPETFRLSALIQRPLVEGNDPKNKVLGAMKEDRWKELIQQLYSMSLIKNKSLPQDLTWEPTAK